MKLRKLTSLIALALLLLGCKEEPMTGPVTIVAFGDSLSAGYHLASESSFPAQL